jgi:proteic killer suppression protein
MIRSFEHRRLGRLFLRVDRVERMGLPGYRLHPVKGDLQGFWSVAVSGNWRIIFRFEEGDAYDMDLIEYH